jgi:putative membrane protein
MSSVLRRAVSVLPAILLVTPAIAQPVFDRDWWYSNWGWQHMAFGGTMMILFWGGIILLAVLLARGLGGGRRDALQARPSPLDILQERFAKGEIDQKEYNERRHALSDAR